MFLWHPLDLLIQSGLLSGMDLRIFDGVVHGDVTSLKHLLDDFKPDGVLSLIAKQTLEEDLTILKWIKEDYGPIVFAEGDITFGEKEAFLMRTHFLDGILADFVSTGFRRYMKGEEVINAAWRENGKVISDWTPDPLNYDCPRHDLLDLSRYYLPYWRPPFASVYTQHGCTSSCSFCHVPRLGPPRFRELEAIQNELDFLNSMNVHKIFFRDCSFNQVPALMVPLCEMIVNRFPKLNFTCWFRPSPLTEEMAKAMKAAGCRYVHLGVETGSVDFLRRLGKDFDLERVPEAIHLLQRNKIRVIGHFMAGVPNETEEDWEQTLVYLRKTKLDLVSVNIYRDALGSRLRVNDKTRGRSRLLRRRLIIAMTKFYLRPDRWPGFLHFIDGVGHAFVSMGRFIRFIFGF